MFCRNVMGARICVTAGYATHGPAIIRRDSFPERSLNFPDVTAPIGRKQTSVDVAVEAAIGPIGYPADVAMFHGIEMNIVGVAFQVVVIADGVLPVAALPY